MLLVVACQDKKRSSQIKVAENESKYVVLAMSLHGEKVRPIRHV